MPICSRNLQREIRRWDLVYSKKVTATITGMRLILWLCPRQQKEAEKVKSDTKQNREEAMELDNSEAKA